MTNEQIDILKQARSIIWQEYDNDAKFYNAIDAGCGVWIAYDELDAIIGYELEQNITGAK